MADFNKTVDLDKGLNQILDRIDKAAEKLHNEGQEAGEAFGSGWDDGLDYTIEKIKASSIKTEKAFSNLSEKIRRQVQQLTANIGGKDTKIKIDFSDIDINSDAIKTKIDKIVRDFAHADLIEFDAKGSEQQFKNLITLYVKYQEKLNSLKQVAPNLTVQKDVISNLQQQIALASQLGEIWQFLDGPRTLPFSENIGHMKDELSAMLKLVKQTKSGKSDAVGEYDELAKVLKEIQGSLKIISDTFKNENNSMQAMAENGKTSFESLSQAIIEVYNNLTRVQSLVDTIANKDFSVTNITQMGGGDSNLQAMTKQMAIARDTIEHLRQLYDQASDTLTLLGQGGQVGVVMEYAKQLQELDLTKINKSVKGADTEMKLASVLAEMQDYIDKLIQINELRNKYNLGEWKDTFVSTHKPITQPVIRSEGLQVETPKATVALDNSEAQQMTNLKGVVDEVSKAIGRKNAGFIKEKEIVDSSVEAEKTKLRELVSVITNEIGNALDSIKVRFQQSFVVPELDKNNLQTSFDEIYNQFVALKDKIQTMQIDIGINTANITTAIQEALYAKEIVKDYRKAEFDDLYLLDLFASWGKEQYQDQMTGDIISKSEAKQRYDAILAEGATVFVNQFGTIIGTIEDVIRDMATKTPTNVAANQSDGAQVIVEAINTQGGRIIESLKLLIPKSITENTDDSALINAFDVLTKAITTYNQQFSRSTDAFFRTILNSGPIGNDQALADALHTLGLMQNGKPKFNIANTGGINEGTILGDKFVLSTQPNASYGVPDIAALMEKQNKAYELGARVPRIITGFEDQNGNVFQLQTRAPGVNHRDASSEMAKASPEQIDRLLYTLEKLAEIGLYPEFGGDNVMYDPKEGFTIIDLDLRDRHRDGLDDPDNMVEAFLRSARGTRGGTYDDNRKFQDLVRQRYALSAEQRLVNADTIAAERAAQQAQQTPSVNAKITPTMDEGAVAKVVADNAAKTPATVKVTPIIDPDVVHRAEQSQQAMGAEGQETIDVAKQFVEAANAKLKFVEANKQVAKSAEESVESIKKETEAIDSIDVTISDDSFMNPGDSFIKSETEAHKENTEAIVAETAAAIELAKVKDIYDNDGNPVKHEDVYKYKNNGAKITENIATDAAGNEIRTIIKDFEAFNKEEKKTRENIAKFQSKLDEFVKRFRSKTGGNAQFIEGFDALSKMKINETNIEDALNAMTQLQAKYNELEGNFRKGQTSLNPFTNAITKASNIDNIFGEVEDKFKALEDTSALENKFTRLQELSQQIKSFVDKINTVPNTVTSQEFTEFSKQVGEFNLLKTQLEGGIKRQGRAEAADAKEQAKAYAEILRLVKERNKALQTVSNSDDGSIKQQNALMDAYKIQQQLHILGKQIVLTDEQRTELARIREEQARKIRDIEADNKVKVDNQKATTREQKRKQDVADYIKLLQQKNEYEKKAAKEDNSQMQAFYLKQIIKLKEQIDKIDIKSIENQAEKNKRLSIEADHQRKLAEIARQKTSGGAFDTQNSKLLGKLKAGYLSQGNFDSWTNELTTYQKYMSGVVKADETAIRNQEASLAQLYDRLMKMSNASRSFFASGGEMLPTWLKPSEIDNASESLRRLYESIVAERFNGMETSITNVKETLGKLTFTVNDGSGSLTQYTIALDKASGATKLLQNTTKPALTILQRFGQSLKKDVTGLLTAVMGGTSIHTFVQYMRQGVQSVRELDLALTELKKVTDETEEAYDKFLDTAANTSARIGSTLSNMTSATAEFAKLGYDIATAASMAESALVYTNVGDNVDVETGSQSIISTLKAFGIEANNTMSIVDKFNEVGNNFAITTKGIGDALQVSASAMAAAGNSLDETIALTTAANTIVQNPNTVGTALKTLSLRIRGVKTELEEAGLETEGMAETTSQLQAKLKALTDGKVDIMIDANNFKNTTQILREMSAEWENMTDVEQAAALELLGGRFCLCV